MRRVRSSFALRSFASSTAGARSHFSSEAEDVELRDLACLNSNLKLGLAGYQLDGFSETSNSHAEDDHELLGEVVDGLIGIHNHHSAAAGVGLDDEPVLKSHELDGSMTATPHVVEPENDNGDDNENSDASGSRSDSHTSFHLTKNNISQQLRSMSQLSGHLSDSGEQPMPAETWTFHYRERSADCLSAPAVDLGLKPSQPLLVAREHDASSSVYSRPISPEAHQAVAKDREPYEFPAELAETTIGAGDWPLREEESLSAGRQDEGECYRHPDDDAQIKTVEPALPAIVANTSTTTISESGAQHRDDKLGRAPSQKSSSSSTTKRSRFLESFTPPRKLVTKRRSIFKFLRAGSRRDQTRSVSTPVLCSPHLRPHVDGPADGEGLLTVQYELTVPETNATRSVSLGNLAVPTTNESQGVASSPDLRHKPSLAEYERHLSIVGDDRRLPSTAKDYNLNRLSQIEEDDKHEHISGNNSFSYHPKTQMTDPLMEAALERQLREKAMFRSTSKRSIAQSEMSVTSFVATSWGEPSTFQPQSPERDSLDSAGGQRPSASHLSPPRTPLEGRPRNSSFIVNTNQRPTANGKKPMILHTPSSISRSSIRSKIGSSLDSWSRYPSHTRRKRCASAGRADNVRTLDFAIDMNHERIRGGTDESDPFRPGCRVRVLTGKHSSRSKTKSLPKSRSATFGGTFARYYSTLFSSPADFHGKGRRTSVAIGGKLHRPELEILAPVMPPSASSPIAQSTMSYMHELEQLHAGPDSNHSTPDNEQTAASAGKEKIHLLSKKDTHHLQVAGSPDSFRPPNFRGDNMFKPLSSEVPKENERSAQVEQEISQPDGSGDYYSARMGRSSLSDSEASSTANAKEDLPTDVDGTVELVETALINTTTTTTETTKRQTSTQILTPSRSQAWSQLYQECLVVPYSPVDGSIEDKDYPPANANTVTETNSGNLKKNTMTPAQSALHNTKLRSPTSSLNLLAATHPNDPATASATASSTATIRRYPSVTVVDDRKGHWRSVSFISVQSGKSGKFGVASTAAGSRAGSRAESFVREGSGDFLTLMEGREREERERLLGLGLGV